jgi:hypothetical protein
MGKAGCHSTPGLVAGGTRSPGRVAPGDGVVALLAAVDSAPGAAVELPVAMGLPVWNHQTLPATSTEAIMRTPTTTNPHARLGRSLCAAWLSCVLLPIAAERGDTRHAVKAGPHRAMRSHACHVCGQLRLMAVAVTEAIPGFSG